MLKKMLITGATVALLSAGVVASPAQAAPALVCHAHQVGNHWTCVTPGSYCPANAHGKFGYAAKTGKRYECLRYSNGRWRWKRA